MELYLYRIGNFGNIWMFAEADKSRTKSVGVATDRHYCRLLAHQKLFTKKQFNSIVFEILDKHIKDIVVHSYDVFGDDFLNKRYFEWQRNPSTGLNHKTYVNLDCPMIDTGHIQKLIVEHLPEYGFITFKKGVDFKVGNHAIPVDSKVEKTPIVSDNDTQLHYITDVELGGMLAQWVYSPEFQKRFQEITAEISKVEP